MSMTVDLVIRDGTRGVARPDHRGLRRHRRTSTSSRSATTTRCRRRAGDARRRPAPAARRHRRATCISATPAIRTRRLGRPAPRRAAFGGVTTVFEMPNTDPADRHRRRSSPMKQKAAEAAYVRLRHPRPARRGHHRPRARDLLDGGVTSFKALHGQHLRQPAVAHRRRDARRLRDLAPTGQPHGAARRERVDHGAAPEAHGGGRAASIRSRIWRRGRRWSRSRRSSRAADLAEWTGARMHIAHHSAPTSCACCARPSAAASTSRARPARSTCCSTPTTCALRRRHAGQPAGARARTTGAAVGRADGRHGRHDRHRPCAAHARGEDARTTSGTATAASPASRRRCR